ncbi:Methionine sulfoxide reductase B [Macrophomina phaseolina MS6]|uniref:Methionine sulfoxide reductase B n=1 Tax=Macrophomina phaseolina (strain MS6) TaxID=1126212 RepID=K2RB73_MACPH|nr:Methionine sulfoxide reductase B [Macrophomina phaseolina MS6]
MSLQRKKSDASWIWRMDGRHVLPLATIFVWLVLLQGLMILRRPQRSTRLQEQLPSTVHSLPHSRLAILQVPVVTSYARILVGRLKLRVKTNVTVKRRGFLLPAQLRTSVSPPCFFAPIIKPVLDNPALLFGYVELDSGVRDWAGAGMMARCGNAAWFRYSSGRSREESQEDLCLALLVFQSHQLPRWASSTGRPSWEEVHVEI